MDHPAESKREWIAGVVTRVYPETWEIDARLIHGSSAVVRRCKIVGHFLPEVHTAERQSKVLVGWSDAYQQAPVAVPVHSAIIPDEERAGHVFWSEHLAFRLRVSRAGVLEVLNTKTGSRFRVEEDGPFVRIESPTTTITMDDAGNLVELDAGNIHLGRGAAEKVVLGSTFLAWLEAFILIFDTHVHPDVGPNSNPAPPLPTILSEVSKTL